MNKINTLFVVFGVVISTLFTITEACKGCVSLDEFNFDKVISRFEVVLVKFDVVYPYGDKHDAFNALATEIVDTQNFIMAEVAIKDYGEKENQEFSKRFSIESKEDLPALRLFVQGEDEPFAFDKKMPWNNENLKTFIRDHTNIYLGLPGCLEQFDKLAVKFVTSTSRENVLKETEKSIEQLTSEREKQLAKIYVKFMNKIVEQGNSFITREKKRLDKIITEGKVNENKKRELSDRLNVLKSFVESQKSEL